MTSIQSPLCSTDAVSATPTPTPTSSPTPTSISTATAETVNPGKASCWKYGPNSCVWRKHGVWDVAQPTHKAGGANDSGGDGDGEGDGVGVGGAPLSSTSNGRAFGSSGSNGRDDDNADLVEEGLADESTRGVDESAPLLCPPSHRCARPVLLKPDHFKYHSDGRPVNFTEDFQVPFLIKYRTAIQKVSRRNIWFKKA